MSKEKDNKILNVAIDIAKNLPCQRYQIAAIITDKRNKVLSIGWNSYRKSHPTQLFWAQKSRNKSKIYFHAEIMALVKCKEGIPNAIYIARVGKRGESRIAKPCDICRNALRSAGIRKVIYTTSVAGGLKEQ